MKYRIYKGELKKADILFEVFCCFLKPIDIVMIWVLQIATKSSMMALLISTLYLSALDKNVWCVRESCYLRMTIFLKL